MVRPQESGVRVSRPAGSHTERSTFDILHQMAMPLAEPFSATSGIGMVHTKSSPIQPG
jgi:hypothetical protein